MNTIIHLFGLICNWLGKSFPLIEKVNVKIFYIFFFGVFIALFIMLFKPFGFYNLDNAYIRKLALAFGFSSAGSLAIASFILPLSFPKFFIKEAWSIGRQVVFLLSFFVLFTLSNWICYAGLRIGQITSISPYSIIGISFLLGIFPSILYILFIEQRHFRALQKTEKLDVSPETHLSYDTHFYTSNKKQKYSYKESDIICIKGCGNYFIIYHETKGKLIQQAIRNTMQSAQEELTNKQFLRCHKSYIVNCDKIESVKGNLKNLKIKVNRLDFKIPVSRNISNEDYQLLLKHSKHNNIKKL